MSEYRYQYPVKICGDCGFVSPGTGMTEAEAHAHASREIDFKKLCETIMFAAAREIDEFRRQPTVIRDILDTTAATANMPEKTDEMDRREG